MADDLTLGECPFCGRQIMLRTTAKSKFVYGKCQGFHTEDRSHCGYSFTHGRAESNRIVAEAARAARTAPPEPEEEEPDDGREPEEEPAGAAATAGDGGGGAGKRGVFRRARKRS